MTTTQATVTKGAPTKGVPTKGRAAIRGLSSWWLLLAGVIGGGALVWFAGPLLAFGELRPLETVAARLSIVALLGLALVGEALWSARRADGRHRQLFDALMQPARERASAASVIEGRFDAAVRGMRAAAPSRQRPWWQRLLPGAPGEDERPWYVFIGPPGSGKTTALIHSDLRFPLAADLGTATVQGVGGTRHCDWWFADRAVLIDTAGRYTTQDSDAQQDAREWQAFLGVLRKHRPHQPINGVLVTVSVADLLQLRPAELEQQAGSVRDRLAELNSGLGHTFPVYLLITKADLLAGFIEFFDGMDREERAQVWGATFELALPAPGLAQRVGQQLDDLITRLRTRAFLRLEQEADPRRRAAIHLFADQLASLRSALLSFVTAAFEQGMPATPVPTGALPLRGFYFTSGTQEGSPIDRVMGAIARTFSLSDRLLPAARGSGRAFFISRLLSEVVFAEASLAGTARQWQRRRAQWRWGLALGVLVICAVLVSAWSWSAIQNARYVSAVANKANVLGDALREAAAFTDLNALTPLYTALHVLANARGVDPASPPSGFGYGLYQGTKLQQATEQSYQRMLQQTLAPVLANRLLRVLRASGEAPALQYETLRTYLMLSQSERLDRGAVKRWVELDLSSGDPATAMEPDALRELLSHVDALMSRNGFQQAVPVDARAVADARQALLKVPLAQRLLFHVKRQADGWALPDFPGPDKADEDTPLVRSSGKPLRAAIPALYTREVYQRAFGSGLDAALTAALEDEAWVLGTTASAARPRLADEVRRRYLDEYGTRWEALFVELAPPSLEAPADLSRVMRRYAAGELRRWLQSAAQELSLPPTEGVARPATASLDARFAALRRFVAGEAGAAAPIDGLLSQLEPLRLALEGKEGPVNEDLFTRLKADVAAAPEPVRGLVGGLVTAATGRLQRQQQDQAAQALRKSVIEGCQQSVAARYPFVPGARQEISLAEFTRLFAPGGVLDEFFVKNLASAVDTSGRPWRLREAAGVDGFTEADVRQFERAAEIRRAFFDNSPSPNVRLQMKPLDMDPAALQFTLDIGGQVLKYAHGPSLPKPVVWPAPGGNAAVRMQMYPPGASGEAGVRYAGSWGMLRMFDNAKLAEIGGPDRLRAVFSIDGQPVTFEVTALRPPNPLRLAALQAFKCPGSGP